MSRSPVHHLACLGLLLATCGAPTAAWAVYKCTGPDGKVSFQDRPCPGKGGRVEVRPATGDAPQPREDGGQETETQRLERYVADSQRDRRRRLIGERLLPDTELAISQLQVQCDQKMKALEAQLNSPPEQGFYTFKRGRGGVNQAAAWAQAISEQMQALSVRCDTQNSNLQRQLRGYQRECEGLGGCERAP